MRAQARSLLRNLLKASRRPRQRRGVAAVEFALLLPMMVILLFGTIDACNALITYRRVTVAAQEAALIATELSVQPDGSTTLTPTQAHQAMSVIFAVMPGLTAAGPAQLFSVTLSVIYFLATPNGCTPGTNCTYSANVAWSVPLSSFAGDAQYYGSQALRGTTGPNARCGVLTQVPQTTLPTYSTVPTQGMSSLTSVLVVDVSYTYNPVFTKPLISPFLGPLLFYHAAFVPPRLGGVSTPYTVQSSNYITYNLANTADTAICPRAQPDPFL